jgi:hypothetical protein
MTRKFSGNGAERRALHFILDEDRENGMKEMKQNVHGFFAAQDSPAGGSSAPKQSYAITVTSTGYGALAADKASAEEGEVVTLTAAPDENNMFRASAMSIYGGGVSGDRVFTDPSVPTPLVYTFTMPGEAVNVTGEFFATAANTVYVTGTGDSGAGSLRQAIADVPNGGTVQSELPAGSVIALDSTISGIKKSLVIEGNGVTLTRSSAWVPDVYSLLRNGISGTELTVSRMHFKNAESSGNGTAIRWDAKLTLKSCIFSNNHNTGATTMAGAIYKAEGDALISGCTFYANSAHVAAVVGFGGGGIALTLVGNLFYGNTANHFPVINLGFGPGVKVYPSYNVVDVGYGKGDTQAGWDEGTGDTTFTNLGITGIPFDTDTFVPVSQLKIIDSAPPDFPTTDFYGAARIFPGAPGAVNAAQ